MSQTATIPPDTESASTWRPDRRHRGQRGGANAGNNDSASQAGDGGEPQGSDNNAGNQGGDGGDPANPDGGGGGGDGDDGSNGSDDGSSDSDNESLGTTDILGMGHDQALTHILLRLTRNAEPKGSTKVRDPTPFDGTDPQKLRAFIMQGELVFRDRPRAFRSDDKKINYMLSYLSGMAFDWFEPHIVHPVKGDVPVWANNYAEFLEELKLNFGPHDAVRDAES